MLIRKVLLLLLLPPTLCVLVFLTTDVGANGFDIQPATHMANFLEKVGERVVGYLRFSKESKASYYLALLDKRMSELAYSVEDNKLDYMEATTSRYSSYLGTTSTFVLNNNLTVYKNPLLELLARHKAYLESINDRFPANSAYWLLIRQDLDTIRIFTDKLSSL